MIECVTSTGVITALGGLAGAVVILAGWVWGLHQTLRDQCQELGRQAEQLVQQGKVLVDISSQVAVMDARLDRLDRPGGDDA